jgi:hypothetical protein
LVVWHGVIGGIQAWILDDSAILVRNNLGDFFSGKSHCFFLGIIEKQSNVIRGMGVAGNLGTDKLIPATPRSRIRNRASGRRISRT